MHVWHSHKRKQNKWNRKKNDIIKENLFLGWNEIHKKRKCSRKSRLQTVNTKTDFYEVIGFKREKINLNSVGTEAEKSRLALDFSVAVFTISGDDRTVSSEF